MRSDAIHEQSQGIPALKATNYSFACLPQLHQHLVIQIKKSLGLSFNDQDQPHRVCFANQNAEL